MYSSIDISISWHIKSIQYYTQYPHALNEGNITVLISVSFTIGGRQFLINYKNVLKMFPPFYIWLWINFNMSWNLSKTISFAVNKCELKINIWFNCLTPVAEKKLLQNIDVCQDDIDSGGPALRTGVTRRSNVTDLVTLTACKGHNRNVKTIILQRQMGPMTKYVRPKSHCTARELQSLSSSHWEMVVVMVRKWQVLFHARGHGWM